MRYCACSLLAWISVLVTTPPARSRITNPHPGTRAAVFSLLLHDTIPTAKQRRHAAGDGSGPHNGGAAKARGGTLPKGYGAVLAPGDTPRTIKATFYADSSVGGCGLSSLGVAPAGGSCALVFKVCAGQETGKRGGKGELEAACRTQGMRVIDCGKPAHWESLISAFFFQPTPLFCPANPPPPPARLPFLLAPRRSPRAHSWACRRPTAPIAPAALSRPLAARALRASRAPSRRAAAASPATATPTRPPACGARRRACRARRHSPACGGPQRGAPAAAEGAAPHPAAARDSALAAASFGPAPCVCGWRAQPRLQPWGRTTALQGY
jgi:hypothetical protein